MAGQVYKYQDLVKCATEYRTILSTDKYSQKTIMYIAPGKNVGREMHPQTDQTVIVLQGNGFAMLSPCDKPEQIDVQEFHIHDMIDVPAGIYHDFYNYDPDNGLKLLVIYSPPLH